MRTKPGARLAPGPRGQALIGSYRDLQRDPLGFFVRCSRDYGHIFRFKPFPAAWWHFVSHPDHLDQLLQRRYLNYPKGFFGRLNSLASGDGLVALEGDRWLRQRKLLQPAFHGSRLAGMATIMTSATEAMLDAWAARAAGTRGGGGHGVGDVGVGVDIDISQELMRLTLGIAGQTLCGVDVGGTAHAFGQAFRETLAYLDYRLVHPFALPLAAPTGRNRRYRQAVARLNAIIDPLIEARRRAGNDTGDVLSALLSARDEQGAAIDAAQIREEIRTALTAGHETTGAALFWSLYLLARHPEQERRLHAEVDALGLGLEHAGPGHVPTVEDLARLPFTRMVIEEALRLYPPIVWLGRVSAAEDEIGGFPVKAGSAVVFSMYVTQRHPDFWERPDAFEPDRFSPERAAARQRGAYLPFGLGPRGCIGERFAMMEAMLVLAVICRRFRLRLLRDDTTIEPELLATLRPPRNVLMRVELR
jgi:cytochrome P450